MSKRLAQLLDQPEDQVVKLIAKLEDKNGYPSHDVRFLADNLQQVRSKITGLGLDPSDTTGEELYHALQAKFEADSRTFDKQLKATDFDLDQKLSKAIDLVGQNLPIPKRWAVKKITAKSLLKQLPPKHTMKYLHYRSVTSMLKHENIFEIYLAAQNLESATWSKQLDRLVSKLDQTDFELRPLKFIHLSSVRYGSLDGPQDYLVVNNDIAAMALWPSSELQKASLLTDILLIVERLNQYQDLKVGSPVAKMGGLVVWWVDMDHLVADLGGEAISMNLKDCATNHLQTNDFEDRVLDHGRASSWRELLNRYENLPDIDGLFDSSVKQKFAKFKFDIPEPVYEYAENYDE